MSYKYEYAGFWLRVVAALIDSFIMILAVLPVAWIFYQGDSDLVFATGLSESAPNLLFDFVINYIFPFLYSVLFWIYLEGTPGKRLLRLKVLDERTGHKLSFGQAALRYIGSKSLPSSVFTSAGHFARSFSMYNACFNNGSVQNFSLQTINFPYCNNDINRILKPASILV